MFAIHGGIVSQGICRTCLLAPVLSMLPGWILPTPLFHGGHRRAIEKTHTVGQVVSEKKKFVDTMVRERFRNDRSQAPFALDNDPLEGVEIEVFLASHLEPLLMLPGWKRFCRSVAIHLSREDDGRKDGAGNHRNGMAVFEEYEMEPDKQIPEQKEGQEQYAGTNFHPRRERSVPLEFAGLSPFPYRRQVLCLMGEMVLSEIEANCGFHRNNMTYAVTLAIGTAIEIERGQVLSESDIIRLRHFVHELLAKDSNFMKQPGESLTVVYDTCLLTSGLMTVFYSDGCVHGRVESVIAARRLAHSLLQTIGWQNGMENGEWKVEN